MITLGYGLSYRKCGRGVYIFSLDLLVNRICKETSKYEVLRDLALSGGNENRWGELQEILHSTNKFLSTYYVLNSGDAAVNITGPCPLWILRI